MILGQSPLINVEIKCFSQQQRYNEILLNHRSFAFILALEGQYAMPKLSIHQPLSICQFMMQEKCLLVTMFIKIQLIVEIQKDTHFRPSVRPSGTITQYLLVRFDSFLVQMISTMDSQTSNKFGQNQPLNT